MSFTFLRKVLLLTGVIFWFFSSNIQKLSHTFQSYREESSKMLHKWINIMLVYYFTLRKTGKNLIFYVLKYNFVRIKIQKNNGH